MSVPLGDFFCQLWAEYALVSSQPVAVNPFGGCNCYWEMPYRSRARIVVENRGDSTAVLFYQVDFEVTEVPEQVAYLRASWRRNNPLPDREASPRMALRRPLPATSRRHRIHRVVVRQQPPGSRGLHPQP